MSKSIADTDISEASLKPGVSFTDHAAMPRFFALAPLYDHLVTRQVDIRSLGDDGALGGGTVSTIFTAIDVELWARRFLGDLDRFLTATTSIRSDGQLGLSAVLAHAIDSRRTIASGIVNQLQGVFDYAAYETDPDPLYQKGLQDARDTLAQLLHVSLIKGYDIPVMGQYDVSSSGGEVRVSPYGRAGLSGTAMTVNFAAANNGVDRERAFVNFSATVTDPERQDSASTRIHAQQDALRLPVPLRIHPAPPAIGEQTASPTFNSPDGLQQLSRWTYRLVFSHACAPQDTVEITTEFNLSRPLSQKRSSPIEVDLFNPLAQFMAVADKLWMLLGAVPDAGSGDDVSHANAVGTFADLAATIAGHWILRRPRDENGSAPDGGDVAGASHTFGVRVAYSENDELIERVSLTRDRSPPGSGEGWPEVEVLLPDGVSVPFVAQPSDSSSRTAVYLPKNGTAVPAFARQTFQLMWNGLDVAALQKARSRMSVVRNEDLLHDPSHPENTGPPTNPAFLLDTAEVVTSNIAPLIETNHPQEINGASLQAALENAIQTLFPPNNLVANTRATWRLDYSYELARSDTSFGGHSQCRARVPVMLYPDGPLSAVAEVLANAGQEWMDACRPAFDAESWILSVTLHSGLEPDARPLFTAELFYPIKK